MSFCHTILSLEAEGMKPEFHATASFNIRLQGALRERDSQTSAPLEHFIQANPYMGAQPENSRTLVRNQAQRQEASCAVSLSKSGRTGWSCPSWARSPEMTLSMQLSETCGNSGS